jgi:serine/threonine-protein kinase RsbW
MLSVRSQSCCPDNPLLQEGCQQARVSSTAEMIPLLEGITHSMVVQGYPQKDIFGMRLALEEAIVNGLKHGHNYDPNKQVVVRYKVGSEHVLVEVKDQGPGFDPLQVPDSTAPENLQRSSGRGLLLMRSYMTWIRYNEQVNAVTLCLKNQRQAGKAASDKAPPSPEGLCQPLPGVEIMSIVETAPPAQVGYAQEAMKQLREAIQHLPTEEKEVFLWRQNGELTYEQIAQLDNRSVEVVKEQMRSALRKLRTVIQAVSSGNHAEPQITRHQEVCDGL